MSSFQDFFPAIPSDVFLAHVLPFLTARDLAYPLTPVCKSMVDVLSSADVSNNLSHRKAKRSNLQFMDDTPAKRRRLYDQLKAVDDEETIKQDSMVAKKDAVKVTGYPSNVLKKIDKWYEVGEIAYYSYKHKLIKCKVIRVAKRNAIPTRSEYVIKIDEEVAWKLEIYVTEIYVPHTSLRAILLKQVEREKKQAKLEKELEKQRLAKEKAWAEFKRAEMLEKKLLEQTADNFKLDMAELEYDENGLIVIS